MWTLIQEKKTGDISKLQELRNESNLNFEIDSPNLGKNVFFYHNNIVINPHAIVGDNCKFHGDNCIGNNGFDEKAPTLGNNVDVGYGACIIGDIEIADNVIIGANSLVNKSFNEPGVIIAGVPAKIIKRSKE
jgi:serine O-acetyltransferase